MNFEDLLVGKRLDPKHVLVLRHRPAEPELRKVLPWVAAEQPDLFNAYQQTQSERLEASMRRSEYLASFVAHGPGKALFVGLYRIGPSKRLTREKFWKIPAYGELARFGWKGFGEHRSSVLWFDLTLERFYADWKGKLVVGWPPPERSWWRRAHQNRFPVLAVLEDSALDRESKAWDEIALTREDLGVLPSRLKSALSQWRGIYYIFDVSDRRGYVGSAYGRENILQRWLAYAATGHGGNVRLRKRDPKNFRFSILQRVSPDMDEPAVIRLEGTWKERLHTGNPNGLNDN